MIKKRSIVEYGKQFAKCRKGFVNYFEYLGKLLQSGKAFTIRESLGKLSFICLLGKVLEVAGKVLPITFQIWESF